jgi:lactoylglutathione lyase
MQIEHIAIWVKDIDEAANFYSKYFGAKIGASYHNPKTGFRSRFITLHSGARIEIMTHPDINVNPAPNTYGYAHIALSVGCIEEVDRLTNEMRKNGVTILSQPRTTGDGYYESKVADPDGNEIELTV